MARPLVATRCAYHQVTLRGLPFKSKEKDIEEFLQPIQPTSIEVVYSSHGRPSGKAIVTLDSEETMQEVLKKDKEYIGRGGCGSTCCVLCSGGACARKVSMDYERFW